MAAPVAASDTREDCLQGAPSQFPIQLVARAYRPHVWWRREARVHTSAIRVSRALHIERSPRKILCYLRSDAVAGRFFRRLIMKWTGLYLLGYVVFIIGILAALWKLGVLARAG